MSADIGESWPTPTDEPTPQAEPPMRRLGHFSGWCLGAAEGADTLRKKNPGGELPGFATK